MKTKDWTVGDMLQVGDRLRAQEPALQVGDRGASGNFQPVKITNIIGEQGIQLNRYWRL